MTINFKDWKKSISESLPQDDISEEVSKSDVPAYLRKAKGEKPLTMADVKEPKKSTISAPANLAKARNEESSCGTKKKKSYNEFVDKYSNYDGSKAVQEAESVDTGEGVQQEVPTKSTVRRADKKVDKLGRKYSTQIKFNNGEDDGKTIGEDFELDEETTFYMEAMIDYSDFQAKIDAHKKAGNKVVDYKHTPEKAHITTIDKEGTKRKVTYKPSGVSMQNMGKHEGDDSDDGGKKVKKTDNEPAVKRGRGRPSGAKSGARQSGSAKQEYRGLAFHSLNLPNKK